jgi:3-methyladenine DNA glycosylase Mpg
MTRPRKLRKSFFGRSVHDVAPELIGATFLFGRTGGVIVEVEAYHRPNRPRILIVGKRSAMP